MINKFEIDDYFLNKTVFNDEVTFHTNGKMNQHKFVYGVRQNPHQII